MFEHLCDMSELSEVKKRVAQCLNFLQHDGF